MTTTLGNTSTTSTVIDISTDERAPLNMAYRYNPEGSVIGADGEIPQWGACVGAYTNR
jgi:hypothetical protein